MKSLIGRRGRARGYELQVDDPEEYSANAAPASLSRDVQAQCPNPACGQLLEFPPEAVGYTVQCGVCGANFPLAR